eukprot:403338824
MEIHANDPMPAQLDYMNPSHKRPAHGQIKPALKSRYRSYGLATNLQQFNSIKALQQQQKQSFPAIPQQKQHLQLEIPKLKLPEIDGLQSLNSPLKDRDRYNPSNSNDNESSSRIPPLSGSQSERQMIQNKVKPSKFGLRLSGFETQRPSQDDGQTKLPDLSSRMSQIFKRKAFNQTVQNSVTLSQTINQNLSTINSSSTKKSAVDGIKQRIERAIEESKQSKAKKIEQILMDQLQIRDQDEIQKLVFMNKDRDQNLKDWQDDQNLPQSLNLQKSKYQSNYNYDQINLNSVKQLFLKNKYGFINNQLYYLDTDRDELMKFEELINNPYAVEKILQDKHSGDRKFQEALEKIKDVKQDLEFEFNVKLKKKQKEFIQSQGDLEKNDDTGNRPDQNTNPIFQKDSKDQNIKILSQLEQKLRDLQKNKDNLVSQREKDREQELKLEIQVLEQEQQLIKQQMEDKKKDAESRIKNLKRRLDIVSKRVSNKQTKGRGKETQVQNQKDSSGEDSDEIAQKTVKKYSQTFSAVKDNLNGQTAHNFIEAIQNDDAQKDMSSWMSKIAQKSPGQKQQQKQFDEEFNSQLKAQPLNKEVFEKLLDKLESQQNFMASVINETQKGQQSVINRAKSSDVNKPVTQLPFTINGVGNVQTYEQVMDYYSVLPSIREQSSNVICLMNEDVIFRIDLEMNFIKPYRLDKYLLFKFPSWVDCKNGTLMYSGGLRQSDSNEPVQFAFIFNTRKNFLNQSKPMEVPRYKHAMALCQQRIFAIGGFSMNKTIVKSVEMYDFDKNIWSRAASMAFERSDLSVFSHQSSHFIYAFGGCFDASLNTVIERYDALEDEWYTLTIQLRDKINKLNQTVFLALDIEIFGGEPYEKSKPDPRTVKKDYVVEENPVNSEVLIYKELKRLPKALPREILVVTTYDKISTLALNNFIDLTNQQNITDKDFKIFNMQLKGTIWDIGCYNTGLYIIRKYNQQYYEFFPIKDRKVQQITLQTDKFNPQSNLEIDFTENLTEQLDKLEEVVFKQQLKKRLIEQRKKQGQAAIGAKEEQFIQNITQGGNSNMLTKSVVLQKVQKIQ